MTHGGNQVALGELASFLGTWVLVEEARYREIKPGWLWVRSPLGHRLLQGIDLRDLQFILDQIRCNGSAEVFLYKLLEVYESVDLPAVLQALDGCLMRRLPNMAKPSERDSQPVPVRSLFVGKSPHILEIAKAWSVASSTACNETPWVSVAQFLDETINQEIDLVVLCGFNLSGSQLLACQKRSAALALPLLYFGSDLGRLTIGPYLIPGEKGCALCQHLPYLPASKFSVNETREAIHGLGLEGPSAWMNSSSVLAYLEAAVDPRSPMTIENLPIHAQMTVTSRGIRQNEAIHPNPCCPYCRSFPTSGLTQGPAFKLARLRLVSRRVLAFDHSPNRQRRSINAQTQSVGILGGGTAGYLTALALNKKFPRLSITLIESSKVPIIGVGEATTPLMPQFLHQDLGLDISDFFARVQPTLKLGIRFDWGQKQRHSFLYPFGPLHLLEPLIYEGHPLHSSLQAVFMESQKVPILAHGQDQLMRQLAPRTAYHLENRRFVGYLYKVAQERGLHILDRQIRSVETDPNHHRVTGLLTDSGERFSFDWYVDCSGFRSLLMGQALASPFISFADQLFTDTAIAAKVPNHGRLQPYTSAKAMDAGWCWNTPQREADHRGYVFSANHKSTDAAVAEMRASFPQMGEPRVVRFNPGRRTHFWRGNVFAMGNAYGFVEPLESTALHMLIRQIGLLVQAFPPTAEDSAAATILNRKVAGFWDYLKWFLSIHFRYNHFIDSPFWNSCRHDMAAGRFDELVDLYRQRGLLSYGSAQALGFDYPDPLWGAEGIDVLLSGQGVPTPLGKPGTGRASWLAWLSSSLDLAESYSFQAEGLAYLDQHPEQLSVWSRGLQDRGPAFIG